MKLLRMLKWRMEGYKTIPYLAICPNCGKEFSGQCTKWLWKVPREVDNQIELHRKGNCND